MLLSKNRVQRWWKTRTDVSKFMELKAYFFASVNAWISTYLSSTRSTLEIGRKVLRKKAWKCPVTYQWRAPCNSWTWQVRTVVHAAPRFSLFHFSVWLKLSTNLHSEKVRKKRNWHNSVLSQQLLFLKNSRAFLILTSDRT